MSTPIRLSRRILFSSAHLYHQKQFTDAENRAHFGRCYTENGHGHNYVLEVFVEGEIDPRTGLVMNLTDLEQVLKDVTSPLDHQHLNFDVPYFKDRVPTTEVIALYCRDEILKSLKAHPSMRLHRLKLFETDDLWSEVWENQGEGSTSGKPSSGPRFEITRETIVRGIHHLELASLTPEQNQALYGICYRTHGHDYKVQVTLSQALDERSGLVVDRDRFDSILKRKLVEPYDGTDLNKSFKNTSCEALTLEFFKILEPEFPAGALKRITIRETRKNVFEFERDQTLQSP